MKNYTRAIKEWSGILGDAAVITDFAQLSHYEKATFDTLQKIVAVIKPVEKEQVIECVKIANHHCVPIYPISTGMNWGLGSTVPPTDKMVILDLGLMNKIIKYDDDLGILVIEPGVTQEQVVKFLKQRHAKFFLACTGSSPHSSIVGNVLERGDGAGPTADRFANSSDFEVILPNGSVIHTGFSRFASCETTSLFKYGVGPSLDGLFTQANFGVITQMTIWLSRVPEHFELLFITADNSKLACLMDSFRELKMQGILNTNVTLVSDYKVLATVHQYQDFCQSYPDFNTWLKQSKCGNWNSAIALNSFSKLQAYALRRLIKKHIKHHVRTLFFLTPTKLHMMKMFNWLTKKLTGFEAAFFEKLLLGYGVPTERNLSAMYWRKKNPPPQNNLDPGRDNCGVIWICPCVPFTGPHIAKANQLMREICFQYGFEPSNVILAYQSRMVIFALILVYDREAEGEDQKAMQCHNAIMEAMIQAGYIPCRLGIHSMRQLPKSVDDFEQFVKTLKQSIDPNNIMSPGRYDFYSQS